MPFLSGMAKHWKSSFESVRRAGGYKGWKVRHVKALSELANGYGYEVPPTAWRNGAGGGGGEEVLFELAGTMGRLPLFIHFRSLHIISSTLF